MFKILTVCQKIWGLRLPFKREVWKSSIHFGLGPKGSCIKENESLRIGQRVSLCADDSVKLEIETVVKIGVQNQPHLHPFNTHPCPWLATASILVAMKTHSQLQRAGLLGRRFNRNCRFDFDYERSEVIVGRRGELIEW